MSSRIKVSFPKGEKLPENIFNDYEWFKANRTQLAEEYGSSVVVIYEKQVLAVAETYQAALEKAEANLPDVPEIITPVVEFVGNKSFRLRRIKSSETGDKA